MQESIRGCLKYIKRPTDSDLRLMMRWRNKSGKWFRDKKPVTFKSTKSWWRTVALNPTRDLCWVITPNGRKIGHVGINKYKGRWELDNVLRGVSGFPGLMSQAVREIIKLGKFRVLYLRTLPNNNHAIHFYEGLGFKKIGKENEMLVMKYV